MFIQIVHYLFTFFQLLLIVRVLSSWVPEIQGQKWLQFISFYTDPYLNLFRKIIPPIGMVDISPIIAFFALQFGENIFLMIVRNYV